MERGTEREERMRRGRRGSCRARWGACGCISLEERRQSRAPPIYSRRTLESVVVARISLSLLLETSRNVNSFRSSAGFGQDM